MLCGSAWIWLRESPAWQVRAFLVLGWVCAEFTLAWGAYPLVGFELLWMFVLAVLGVRRWRAERGGAGAGVQLEPSLPA